MSCSISNINQRKERWRSFMDMRSPVKNMFLINVYDDINQRRPFPRPELKRERLEWIWENYSLRSETAEWLNDDSIPYLDMLTGTEVFAQAFGCKVHYPDDNMPFALPLIESAAEAARLKVPNLWDSSLVYLFEMADELKRRAGSDALFRAVDIQSPMDIAALIWDKNYFYMALLEEPEAVKELASKVKELLTQFLDEWFKRYGKEYIAHFPTYYMTEGITLSEDEIGVIRPELFDELFLPELSELSERYGGIGIHCCADSMHQWNNLKKVPNLKLLNLIRPKEQLVKAYRFFESHTAQMHSWHGDRQNPEEWVKNLPQNAHVAFELSAKDKTEALSLCDRLASLCR
jgi:hypothetical protein